MNTPLLLGAELPRAYMPEAKSQEWGTPKAFFDKLNAEFHFTIDVCASLLNAKCAQYFNKEQDGLKQDWFGAAFCNPPYGAQEIEKWLEHGFHEAGRHGTTTVFLLPNTTDVGWFHRWLYDEATNTFMPGVEVRFVKGRINFDPPPGQASISNVKGSIIVIVRPR